MKDVLNWLGIAFCLFLTGSMIKLWKYNVESNGWLFAFAMVLGTSVTTILLVYHYFKNR